MATSGTQAKFMFNGSSGSGYLTLKYADPQVSAAQLKSVGTALTTYGPNFLENEPVEITKIQLINTSVNEIIP